MFVSRLLHGRNTGSRYEAVMPRNIGRKEATSPQRSDRKCGHSGQSLKNVPFKKRYAAASDESSGSILEVVFGSKDGKGDDG